MRLRRADDGVSTVLAVNKNSFVDIRLLNVARVREHQRHNLTCKRHSYIQTAATHDHPQGGVQDFSLGPKTEGRQQGGVLPVGDSNLPHQK